MAGVTGTYSSGMVPGSLYIEWLFIGPPAVSLSWLELGWLTNLKKLFGYFIDDNKMIRNYLHYLTGLSGIIRGIPPIMTL